jgi:hypothetical protein
MKGAGEERDGAYMGSSIRSRINISCALANWWSTLLKACCRSRTCNGAGNFAVMIVASIDLGLFNFTVKHLLFISYRLKKHLT